MGTILESLHKFHIQTAVDDLQEQGGNQNVTDHPLDGVYRCKICGWIYDEKEQGKPFTTLSHCPLCNVGQQNFERIS